MIVLKLEIKTRSETAWTNLRKS